jgi:hypothetical protein
MKKILYSPGYGAGWSTWMDHEMRQFACTYQPLIEAVERGEDITEDHPALQQFEKEVMEKFNTDYVCTLGSKDLKVAQFLDTTLVRIHEYDGHESIESLEEATNEYF